MAKLTTAEMIDAIKELSVLELNELVKACEEEFGVSAAAGVVVAAAGGDAAAAEEKTEFDVELTEVGPMWLTLKLEVGYSKDEILEGYLNTINYGHGMYGIQNASQFYFDKNANDLTLAEATLLVGIPKSPSNYSPLVNFDLAKKRQINILYSLYKNKKITEDEYNQAVNEELKIVGEKNYQQLSTIMYYQDAVMRELKTIKSIPDTYLDTGGIRIYTNLDTNAQKILEDSINNNLSKNNDLQASGVMMDPNTGKIIA